MSNSETVTQRWLRQNIQTYPNHQRLYADTDALLARFPTIRPKTDVYTYDDGRTQLLLCLHGLLPILFRNASYNIPIAIWVTRDYPREPPIVYVVPTSEMLVRPGPYVDVSGRCSIDYIQDWSRKSEGCNLSSLVEALQQQFSREPPVYARPRQPQQRPQSPSPPHPQSIVIGPDYGSRPPPPPPLTTTTSSVPGGARPALPPKPGSSSSAVLPINAPAPSPAPLTTAPSPFSNTDYSHKPPPPPPSIGAPAPYAAPPPAPPPSLPISPPPPPALQHPWATGSPAPGYHTPGHGPTPGGPSPPPLLPPTFYKPPPPLPQAPSAAWSPPPLPPQPAPNFLDDEDSVSGAIASSAPVVAATSTTAAPPQAPVAPARPPNPELLALHARVHEKLRAELATLSEALALDAERLRAHQQDLLAGEPAIRDERARLEAVRDVCRTVGARFRGAVDQGESVVADLRRKGDPSVDELVCSTSIVHNQLFNLVAEDNAIEDTIYHLHRALNAGRIDLERFLRTTRVLAEEQFMKRVLIERIQTGLNGGFVGGVPGAGRST